MKVPIFNRNHANFYLLLDYCKNRKDLFKDDPYFLNLLKISQFNISELKLKFPKEFRECVEDALDMEETLVAMLETDHSLNTEE
jgi:hypothetical protein